MSHLCLLIEFIALLAAPAASWNFKILGLDEEKIEITRVKVFGIRAFLAMPRLYNEQPYTLVEVPWPENSFFATFSTKAFPSGQPQTIGDCAKVQSVVTLDIDVKGRMYVLDRGIEDLCPPKIVVYDLRINREILKKELTGIPPNNLSTLVIDTSPSAKNARLIVADAGNNSLLIFNLLTNNWWRLSIMSTTKCANNSVSEESEKISFDELAISPANNILYATSSERPELYSINLQELSSIEEPTSSPVNSHNYNATEISIKHVGNKFGKSRGLFVDTKGNLYYVYERDHVVLKWNPSYPFETENQNVVLQSYVQMPYPVQLFSEPFYQLWALNSKRNQDSAYVVKIKT